jgi:hypothetical protein
MSEIRSHVINSKDAELAARRVSAWVNGQRLKVELVTVSEVVFDGSLRTTIFWKRAAGYLSAEDNLGHKSRPKTGEKRVTRQPLKMDRFPNSIHDAIIELRRRGKFWLEIERVSSLPFSENWLHDGGGFVDWEALPAEVLALFPGRRLPKSSIHRWYDLRVEQGSNSGPQKAEI